MAAHPPRPLPAYPLISWAAMKRDFSSLREMLGMDILLTELQNINAQKLYAAVHQKKRCMSIWR